jgi:succinoglycan biosynthesis protein ExoA
MPFVSVIVPCYNEQATIGLLLDAICRQTYSLADLEVIIADGMSTDNTRESIAAFQSQHPEVRLRVIDNPKRAIPSALNRAIEAAQGEFIVRLDAHSIPAPDYIERCITSLQAGYGDNVGGIWCIQPGASGWIARSIAIAAAHPLGVGDAIYRVGGQAQEVDTIPFGAFRRKYIIQIGMYDEKLLTNEDYELNTRICMAGGKVWLDPAIQSSYMTRPTLIALAQQYWRYGFWKAQMLRRYPSTLRWRQALPPAFVASLVGIGLLSIWLPLARWLFSLEVALYILVLLGVGFQLMLKHRNPAYILGIPLAMITMHLSWGAALLWGIFRPAHLASTRKG